MKTILVQTTVTDRLDIRAGDLYRWDGTISEENAKLVKGKELGDVVKSVIRPTAIELKFTSDEELSMGHQFDHEGFMCAVYNQDQDGVYTAIGYPL